jgi:ABC-type uncharacterized transport system permease subunit
MGRSPMLTETLADVLFFSTAAAYVAASVLFLRFLARGKGDVGTAGPRLIAIGAVLHGGHIIVASLVLRKCPVAGLHFPISVASMAMCVAYVVARKRLKIDIAGAFVAPLALTSLLASHFVGLEEPSTTVKSAILPFHVTTILFALALFALAFSAATLYLVQERLLKRKRIDGVFRRLPPLDVLDRAEHRFLLAGFPLLTIGIVTGTLWARRVEMGAPGEVLRAVFGWIMWLVIAGVLFLRAAAGWRGRRAAYGTIAGFGFAVLVLLFYILRAAQTPPSARTASMPSDPKAPIVLVAPIATQAAAIHP